jgi:hypothetical protein
VPQGSFQQENGVNISGQNGGQVFDGTNTRLRFGVAQCLEVLVDVPTYSYFDALSGHADVTPAIKWQISPVPGKIDLSATLGAGLPRHQGDCGSGCAALPRISVVVGIKRRLERPRHADEFCRARRPRRPKRLS